MLRWSRFPAPAWSGRSAGLTEPARGTRARRVSPATPDGRTRLYRVFPGARDEGEGRRGLDVIVLIADEWRPRGGRTPFHAKSRAKGLLLPLILGGAPRGL